MTKNSMPEEFDGTETMTQEDILMKEDEILRALIDAGTEKDDESVYRRIEIRRNGALKFAFRIRPVSEEESLHCYEYATKYAPRKRGQPKRAIETDMAKFRSRLIYTATVDEDRTKTWDNRRAQEALNVLTGTDLIDAVLLAGEKDRVIDEINDISGYGDDMEEAAKN